MKFNQEFPRAIDSIVYNPLRDVVPNEGLIPIEVNFDVTNDKVFER